MDFLLPKYDTPGNGIDKNAPQKKGTALLMDILKREFWTLLKLSCLFILFCIPLVTIGPAYSAMTKIILKMVRNLPVDLFHDFFSTFREEFIKSLITIVIIIVLALSLIIPIQYFSSNMKANLLNQIFLGFFILIAFLLSLALPFVFPLLVSVDLPLITICKNALLLGITCFKKVFPLILIQAFLLAVLVTYFSIIGILFFSIFISFVNLINFLIVWPDVQKYIIK